MSSSAEYVLDSSAVLALLGLEPGHEHLTGLLERSIISAVNLAEIANKLARETPSVPAVRQLLAHMELTVVEWTEDLAYLSAEFTQFNKSHGLSLGDRACLTLAKHLRATAVTSDRAWRRIPSLGVRIMIFR
ncbi:MAG: type II toxin-antitoxin system VapC family toxin [Bryobacteraceae bacterium]